MAVSDHFLDAVRDVLGFIPDLRAKRMFGGAGIYAGPIMFALAVDEALYLKSDAETAAEFDARGLAPFLWRDRSGREIAMSYRQAPEDLWEDPDVARDWADRALAAARRKGG
jgi:DNA transformation protein and related proteins